MARPITSKTARIPRPTARPISQTNSLIASSALLSAESSGHFSAAKFK